MIRELHRLEPSLQIVPFCMHKYFVGGDDRKFYRRLLKGFPQILLNWTIGTVLRWRIFAFFASSRAVLAMRFHSVVFSLATNTPFLAVDYTMGGKIAGLLSDVGAPELIRSIADFDGKSTASALLDVEPAQRDADELARAIESALGRAFDRCFRDAAIQRGQRMPVGLIMQGDEQLDWRDGTHQEPRAFMRPSASGKGRCRVALDLQRLADLLLISPKKHQKTYSQPIPAHSPRG